MFWASHVVHHSSQYFNLSTALRQTWVADDLLPVLDADRAARLPAVDDLHDAGRQPDLPVLDPHRARSEAAAAPVEYVINTPSHHRVHHGANDVYLDRNYAGILIIWDRMFGTFQGEEERVRYGLTKNIRTFNPFRVAFHEYQAMWRDVRAAPTTGTTGSATCSAGPPGGLAATAGALAHSDPLPARGGGAPPPT